MHTIAAYRHVYCIFFSRISHTCFSYFAYMDVSRISHTYFSYFTYMDVSWAHSVLQLCAEKTWCKLSVLIMGKGFERYSRFLVPVF